MIFIGPGESEVESEPFISMSDSVVLTTLFNQIVLMNVFSSLSGSSLQMKISMSKKTPGGMRKTSKIQGGIGNQNSHNLLIG